MEEHLQRMEARVRHIRGVFHGGLQDSSWQHCDQLIDFFVGLHEDMEQIAEAYNECHPHWGVRVHDSLKDKFDNGEETNIYSSSRSK